MSALSALTLRIACNQRDRAALDAADGVSSTNIYLGNPLNVQVALFNNTPSSTSFINDISNIISASLAIRSVNPQGELLVQKDVDAASALPGFNTACTYTKWADGTEQHFQFSLGILDTNVLVPSCGRLEYYAGLAVVTTTGPILVGFFKGFFVDDGVAVWIVGVTSQGAPVLFFRNVDSYIGLPTSIDSINGSLLLNGSVVKVIINGSDSEWDVKKPATMFTDLDAGIIRLADGTAHLERTIGL